MHPFGRWWSELVARGATLAPVPGERVTVATARIPAPAVYLVVDASRRAALAARIVDAGGTRPPRHGCCASTPGGTLPRETAARACIVLCDANIEFAPSTARGAARESSYAWTATTRRRFCAR
jgi:hypothetical protein